MEKLSSEQTSLTSVSVSRASDSNHVITESTFDSLAVGSSIKLKAVSFLKLQPGDFVLVGSNQGCLLRRFVNVSVTEGNTRLVMIDGEGRKELMPFVRLIARLESVLNEGAWVNPNPTHLLQRVGFRIRSWLSAKKSRDSRAAAQSA